MALFGGLVSDIIVPISNIAFTIRKTFWIIYFVGITFIGDLQI
jgi:hypothetical protein